MSAGVMLGSPPLLIRLRRAIICSINWGKREGNSLECWRGKFRGLLQNTLKGQQSETLVIASPNQGDFHFPPTRDG